MSRRITYGQGSAQVELTGTEGALVDRLLRESYPRISASIERKVRDIYERAHREWPIGARYSKSGYQWRKGGASRAGLRWALQVDPGAGMLRGVIWNEEDYVVYIKAWGTPGTGHTWTELIRKPMQAAADELVGELGDELMAVAGGR